MLKHVIWLGATGDSATIVGKTITKTDERYEVFCPLIASNMAEALDLKDAKTMKPPSTREAWGPEVRSMLGVGNTLFSSQ